MKYKISFLFVFCFLRLAAGDDYVFTDRMKMAYDRVLSLRFEEAKKLLIDERTANPDNLLIVYVEDYMDFLRILINEDPEEFALLSEHKDQRLKLLSKGDKSSPWYRLFQAEVLLHWALARLKFDQYYSAFGEVKKALNLLQKNVAEFPDFMANKKSLGLLHTVIGTIPDNYKWGARLLGFKGTVNQGLRELKEVIDYSQAHPGFFFTKETEAIYAFLLSHFGNKKVEAWQHLTQGSLNPKTNPLAAFVCSNVALRAGKHEKVIEILENAPRDNAFHPFYYLDFQLGCSKLKRLDKDASVYLSRYISKHPGIHFIKDAYQKLAWIAFLDNDLVTYQKRMIKVKSEGAKIMGSDKKAHREAVSREFPNHALLEARLLSDGGYYKEALDKLKDKAVADYREEHHMVEHHYRKGRIFHYLKAFDAAIESYKATIDKGRELPHYYACNAALQIGLIYEGLKDKTHAISYFKECLKIKPKEYGISLHHKAKVGISRLEE